MTDRNEGPQAPDGDSGRTYHPYKKHKGHSAKGSRCPDHYDGDIQDLLDSALPDEGNNRLLFNIYFRDNIPAGIVAFRMESEGIYHGYPESLHRVPPAVFEQLCRNSNIDERDRRRLLRGSWS